MLRALALCLLFVGCHAPKTAESSLAPPLPAASSSSKPSASPDEPCPPIATASLEPNHPKPDATPIDLAEIFPREEKRVPGAPVLIVDVGAVQVDRDLPTPPPWSRGIFGMGWAGLAAEWVRSGLSASVSAPFEAWVEARKALVEQQRRAYLLEKRAHFLRAVPTAAQADELRCVQAAFSRAEDEIATQKAATKAAAERVIPGLEALATLTPSEKMLLATLLEDRVGRRQDHADVERPLLLFSEVANDETGATELRARAAEAMARVQPRAERKVVVAALEQVLVLSRDPELIVETLIKLADLSETAVEREKLLVKIVAHLDQHGGGWRLAHSLSSLAQLRYERGAVALAVADAARCARETGGDMDDVDPWGCALILGDSLAYLGGAPQGVTIPLRFLGPVALASIRAAVPRYDRDQARHVANLLLVRRPDAAEAHQVLGALMSLTPGDAERSALAERQTRDYGPTSAWRVAQRERLAGDVLPEQLEERLAALVAPAHVHYPPEPTTPAARRAEVKERLRQVLDTCQYELAGSPRAIAGRIDTTKRWPVAILRGANETANACLQQATAASFRSLGPARIGFRIQAK